LSYRSIQLEQMPDDFQQFFSLSSTLIRQSLQSQHALTCLLPAKAGEILESQGIYQNRSLNVEMNEWESDCWYYEKDLEQLAQQLKIILDDRFQKNFSHTLAVVETSTGGRIASSLLSVSGMSSHFKESIILYDQESKIGLLGEIGKRNVVSQTMAESLAKAFQQKTKADFVLSETGMAGPPEGIRKSNKHGQSHFSLVSYKSNQHLLTKMNPFLSKKSHQLLFSIEALKWMINTLKSIG